MCVCLYVCVCMCAYIKHVPKVMPSIYVHGNHNKYKEYNNIVGLSNFSCTKHHMFSFSLVWFYGISTLCVI